MARRQQRVAGIPRRGRPAGGPAAGNVRALPGSRPRQQAQRPDYRGSRRRAGGRGLDVLPTAAVGECRAGGPAAGRAARIRRGSGAARDRRASGRSDQAAAGDRARVRGKSCGGGRKRRSALCPGPRPCGVRPPRRPAASASEHGDDAARGALGVAGRSRLLGPPHAPSAERPAPPPGRRSGHVGDDIPEPSRRPAGNRRRQPAVDRFPAPGLRRHLLLRRHPRDRCAGFQPGFSADRHCPRAAPDFALRPDDRRGAARRRPAVPDRGRDRQAAGGKRGRIGLRHMGARLPRAEARGNRAGRAGGTFPGIRRRAPLPRRRECCSSRW